MCTTSCAPQNGRRAGHFDPSEPGVLPFAGSRWWPWWAPRWVRRAGPADTRPDAPGLRSGHPGGALPPPAGDRHAGGLVGVCGGRRDPDRRPVPEPISPWHRPGVDRHRVRHRAVRRTSAFGRRGGIFGTCSRWPGDLFLDYSARRDLDIALFAIAAALIGAGLVVTRLIETSGRPLPVGVAEEMDGRPRPAPLDAGPAGNLVDLGADAETVGARDDRPWGTSR